MDSKDHLWKQFEKLGEMIGDGLHSESDGKWIVRDYNKLSKILLPDMWENVRKEQNKARNVAIEKVLKRDKCPNCQGEFKQSRSGSLVVECKICNKKYKYKIKK